MGIKVGEAAGGARLYSSPPCDAVEPLNKWIWTGIFTFQIKHETHLYYFYLFFLSFARIVWAQLSLTP